MEFRTNLVFNCKKIIRAKRPWVYPALAVLCLIHISCIKKLDLYQGDKDKYNGKNQTKEQIVVCEPDFFYPFDKEVPQINTKLTIHTRTKLPENIEGMRTEIPPLKYNKSWLFLLTQDDCKQAAFSCTWAAINGQPLSDSYFYDLAHVQAGDFPPDSYYLGKTLGSTDGAGNNIRFSFTTTLSPEWEYMDKTTTVHKGYKDNFYRFYMKDGLFWGNVKEMLNYGVGIAFHDLRVDNADKNNEDVLLNHLDKAHEIIQNKLGRDCKMLARPDGNNTHISAGKRATYVQTMTTESEGLKLYPALTSDLYKVVIDRSFYNSSEKDPQSTQDKIKEVVINELAKAEEDRAAICVGVHGTDREWANLFLWLNDEYGKDGKDNMWMPSQEEYYEYTCYRRDGQISVRRIDDNTLELTIEANGGSTFCYPSVTVNLYGIETKDIASIDTDENTTGFSYADFKEKGCVMMNIDCRKYLTEHAENFVKRYEANPTVKANKDDALYFVSMLKESDKKSELLKRIK